jgi:transposase
LAITNATATWEQVWAAFRRTHDVRLRERYHSILLLMDGNSCDEIAQWVYRDEKTIRPWVHTLPEAGLAGLERAPIPGRPAWLKAEQRTQVKEAVRRCPRRSGYHISSWTTMLVGHFIDTRLGMEHCQERVLQLLHALGFRLRRLRHRHLKAKPEEQAAFQAELGALLEN